jgi:hypothetical protein
LPVGWPETSCPRCLVNVSVDALDPARVFPPGVTEMSLGDYELLDEIARGGMGSCIARGSGVSSASSR